MLEGRELLLGLALKYGGDWDKIYEAVKTKVYISEKEYLELKYKNRSNYLTFLDENYPTLLKEVQRPPFVLFYYGDIDLLNYPKKITIVGSRNCSDYGKLSTIKITHALVENDYVIISGMARGIDTISHQAALENGGKTIAILGNGIDDAYPKENKLLYEKIKENGLVISEYPFNIAPNKENFPRRNRLLAMLGNGLVIPEYKNSSGTSITLSLAISYGKTIFSLPHPIDDLSANNTLIKDGAVLVENGNDIIFELENKN